MRKIEQNMLKAIYNGTDWKQDNTRVHTIVGGMEVQLHGNTLGVYEDLGGGNYGFTVNMNTLKRYPTNTSKSRLRALGVNVYTKKGVTYVDDCAIG
jgi:hypothetical protein